jgi:flagellar motor switch protein FliN/FliY
MADMDEVESSAAAVPEAPNGDSKAQHGDGETIPASAGAQAAAAGGGLGSDSTSEPPGASPGPGIPGLNVPGISLLYDVELDATLQFGSKEMLLREVLELGPGDVVELDRHIAEPVDLVVGDRIVARGEVVVVSGNFGLRIIEVATPQMRLESIRCLF